MPNNITVVGGGDQDTVSNTKTSAIPCLSPEAGYVEREVVANFESRRSHCNGEHCGGFMKYGEMFEDKVQVFLSGVFVAKWNQGRRESW